MKPESRQVIKDALKERGELPLTWECGCDSSILNFSGWYSNWSSFSQTLQESLHDLRDHIVYELNLPGAGPVMDEGEGKIAIDADDSVKLTYSSKYLVFEMPDIELAEILRDLKDHSITIKELAVEDFRFDITIDEDTSPKEAAEQFSATPDLNDANKKELLDALQEYLPDFGKEYWMTNKRSNKDFVKCRSLEIYGNWTLKSQTLVVTRWCGIEYVEHDLKEQQVTLF